MAETEANIWNRKARVADAGIGFRRDRGGQEFWAEDWCFVTGWARTGGMALTRMLSEHPDVSLTVEDGFPHMLYTVLMAGLFQTEGDDGITLKHAHSPWKKWELGEFLKTWRTLRCGGARIVGDKLYMYWSTRAQLREMFPECSLVYTYRNPLDQLASFIAEGATWLEPQGTTESIGTFLNALSRIHNDLEEARGYYKTRVVQFEALAGSLDRIIMLRDLWKWLGVEDGELPATHNARVSSDLYDAPEGAVGRWRRSPHILQHLGALTHDQLRQVEEVCRVCGYDILLQELCEAAVDGRRMVQWTGRRQDRC
jgi:hypothetical protein